MLANSPAQPTGLPGPVVHFLGVLEVGQMKAVSAPGATSPALLDFGKSLLESFAINKRANQLLICNIGDAAWQVAPPDGKRAQLCQCSPAYSSRPTDFRPNDVAFVGYLIAHDSHHRGRIAMMAWQVGHPVAPRIGFGLWEWGTLWKECGLGGPGK